MGEAKQKQLKQKMRFSDSEFQVLKYFSDNEDPLYAIRKSLLQFELNDEEQKLIDSLIPELLAMLKKILVLEIDPAAPLFSEQDFFKEVNFQEPDLAKIALEIASRMIEEEYMTQQFEELSGKKNRKIIFKSLLPNRDKERDQMIVELSARNMIMRHINFQLNTIRTLAGQPNETVEQLKERLLRDSNR
jgi:hypothetical protein